MGNVGGGHVPIRVVHLTNTAVGGGIQRVVLDLARAGSEAGWDVRVVFWRGEYPVEPYGSYTRLESSGRMREWPRGWFRYIRAHQPDLVHLHGPTAGSIGALVAHLARQQPILYTDHAPHRQRPLLARVPRLLAGRVPDLNVAISSDVAGSLVADCRVPASRVRIIRNGTPVVPRLAAPLGEKRRFVYVANLVEWKAHETLLMALARTDQRCELALVGDGPLQGHLRRTSEDLGISDRVDFCGFLPDPWTSAEGAWACVHPPEMEGGGLAAMEAMMRGLPVIATATGGLMDIVRDRENGLVVPVGDPEALARAIQRLADDPGERTILAARARAYAEEHLTISRVVDSYAALYEEMLSGTRC